jgi:hypothetical protein
MFKQFYIRLVRGLISIGLPLVLICLAGGTNCAIAQEWARRMFKEFEHDFGTVAKNEKAEHRFVIENTFKEEITIRDIKTSCTCTDISLEKRVLKSRETAELVAVFNTRTFVGYKQATITVYFQHPYVAEVQLTVRGTIRSDVMFEPGAIEFGSMSRAMIESEQHHKQIQITKFNNMNWRIVDVKSTFPHVGVSLTKPIQTGNQLRYTMDVRLKESAPAGFIQGELIVVADEFGLMTSVPVKFSAKVETALQISPEVLTISSAQAGSVIEKKILIKADKPFRILDVTCSNPAFEVSGEADDLKKVHFVVVSYTVKQPPGRYEYTLEFVTDLNEKTTAKMQAIVEIDEPTTGAISSSGGS